MKTWCVYHRKRRWIGKRVAYTIPLGKGKFYLLTATECLTISFMPYRGYFIQDRWSREYGTLGPPEGSVREFWRPSVKKVKVMSRAAVKHLASLETKYFEKLMTLINAIAMLQYEDGSPRQACYLGIWTQGSAWVVRINDKDADAQLTAEGRTIDEAIDTLVYLLESDEAPWEPCGRKKGKGK